MRKGSKSNREREREREREISSFDSKEREKKKRDEAGVHEIFPISKFHARESWPVSRHLACSPFTHSLAPRLLTTYESSSDQWNNKVLLQLAWKLCNSFIIFPRASLPPFVSLSLFFAVSCLCFFCAGRFVGHRLHVRTKKKKKKWKGRKEEIAWFNDEQGRRGIVSRGEKQGWNKKVKRGKLVEGGGRIFVLANAFYFRRVTYQSKIKRTRYFFPFSVFLVSLFFFSLSFCPFFHFPLSFSRFFLSVSRSFPGTLSALFFLFLAVPLLHVSLSLSLILSLFVPVVFSWFCVSLRTSRTCSPRYESREHFSTREKPRTTTVHVECSLDIARLDNAVVVSGGWFNYLEMDLLEGRVILIVECDLEFSITVEKLIGHKILESNFVVFHVKH